MRTFFILFVAAVFNNVFAQQPKTVNARPKTKLSQDAQVKSFIIMKDKKIWMVKNDKDSLITNVINMGGVKIATDGSVTLKDGTTSMLKEGDKVTPNEVIIRAVDELHQK